MSVQIRLTLVVAECAAEFDESNREADEVVADTLDRC